MRAEIPPALDFPVYIRDYDIPFPRLYGIIEDEEITAVDPGSRHAVIRCGEEDVVHAPEMFGREADPLGPVTINGIETTLFH